MGGTILGTDQFMSPEVFKGDEEHPYGFEVDMWAFGVLFFTMINKDFPFSICVIILELPFTGSQERKGLYLMKLAEKFSYKRTV